MSDTDPLRKQYSSNSNKAKQEAAEAAKEKPKVEKVISGTARERKPRMSRRIAEQFTGDDMGSVGQYIIFEVALPAIKQLISDGVSQGVERLLFGDRGRTVTSRSKSSGGYTPYNRVKTSSTSSQPTQRSISDGARANHAFNDILLETRGEAETVLMKLHQLLDDFDVVTVSDMYAAVEITPKFVDDKFGWFNLDGANVQRVGGREPGYVLNLPQPVPID